MRANKPYHYHYESGRKDDFPVTGFSGHGFGIDPVASRALADLVTGTTPLFDPHDFRLARFGQASKLRPQKGT